MADSGAGTPNVTAFEYYRMQKLSAYDTIVLSHDSSLTGVCIPSNPTKKARR